MAQLQHKFVTELEQADRILPSDFILLSQKGQDDIEYMSRKLSYQNLCAAVLTDIDDKVSTSISAAISTLTLSVETNISAISALSVNLNETTSAVIKIANCVQKNKVDISAMSATVSSLIPLQGITLSGLSGVTVTRTPGQYRWNIAHTNNIQPQTAKFSKVSYDAHGHLTADLAVASADIVTLGNFVTQAGTGLSYANHALSLKTATTGEIGGVKVNGNNLQILANGTLSAKDTTYTAGTGLSLNTSNQFSLVPAASSRLGGVKIGSNLSIDNTGVLCAAYIGPANAVSAGVVQLGYVENGRDYALKTANGKAYVTVPWTDTSPTFNTGEYHTTDRYSVISAISYGNGNITGISASFALYQLIQEVSAHAQDVGDLSDCIQVSNGSITYNTNSGRLTLSGGYPRRGLDLGGTDIPAVVSGEVVTAAYTYDGEGQEVESKGLYIKLAKNTAKERADNIYIDARELTSTSTYTAGTGLSLNTSNQFSLKTATTGEIGGVKVNGNNLQILANGTLSAKDTTYTAGTGLSLNTSNQFSIPKTESWTFTLDNGTTTTTTTRTVALI